MNVMFNYDGLNMTFMRTNTYKPLLTSSPDNNAEIDEGAALWAFGSQLKTGKKADLTPTAAIMKIYAVEMKLTLLTSAIRSVNSSMLSVPKALYSIAIPTK